MFRQDRTNPSTAISNWRGRHESSKGWPSTAVSTWLNGGLFGASFNSIEASGGTISDYTNATDGFEYRSHIFNSSGTFTISANPDGHVFDVLVVGGGSGSGPDYRSGGGGGEMLKTLGQTGNVESYTVTIGAGGAAVGGDSVFVSAPATTAALTGRHGIHAQPTPYGAGASGNGNAGGNSGASGGGGGGGGSGGAGTPGSVWLGAQGGTGSTQTEFQASSAYFGGGGGGGSNNGYAPPPTSWLGSGGNGGGGNGGRMGWSTSGIPISTVGGTNTGGGGGGNGASGGGQPSFMCNGGSGKVIVRYALEDTS